MPYGLDWQNERYVRLYVADNPAWNLLGFQGQAVYMALKRKLDRAGTLACAGEGPVNAVIALLPSWPPEVVAAGMEMLLKRSWVHFNEDHDLLVDPDHLSSEEAVQSNRQRCAESRKRRAEIKVVEQLRLFDSHRVADDANRVIHDAAHVKSDALRRSVTQRDTPCLTVSNISDSVSSSQVGSTTYTQTILHRPADEGVLNNGSGHPVDARNGVPPPEGARAKAAERESKREAERLTEAEFNQWWAVWPRKVNRLEALKEFRRLRGKDKLPPVAGLIEITHRQQRALDWVGDKFTPLGKTWLHQERFRDDLEALEKAPRRSSQGLSRIRASHEGDVHIPVNE